MRRATLLLALVVLGPLAACGIGGDPPRGHLVASPDAVVLDLPETGSGSDTATVTVRNIGLGDTGTLQTGFTLDLSPGEEAITGAEPVHDCAGEELGFGESCTLTVTITGRVPDGDYESSWSIQAEHADTVFVPITIV